MTKIKVDDKASFEANLLRRLKGDVEKQFARHFFADLSITDLNQRQWQDVITSLKSSWKFYRGFNGETPHMRVVSDDDRHLVIELASKNLPFLLDSIRMEINSLGLVLTDVQQSLMGVVRSSRKMMISDEVEINESLIRLEIEQQGAPESIAEQIQGIIETVEQVVADFPSMRRQLLLWSDRPDFDISFDESYALLRWFYANNFTFLGYEEYKPGAKGKLKIMPRSRLGLARPGRVAEGLNIKVPEAVLEIEKLPVRSPVHRPAYLDSLTVCERRGNKVVRVCRFMGLFTASVYTQVPADIPLIRGKVKQIFTDSDLMPSSHRGRELSRIIGILPREELFFAEADELFRLVTQIFSLRERRIVRVLARQDNYFANCIVYVPKDTYNTTLRVEMEALLVSTFKASHAEFSTFFSESALTRTHFTMRINKKVEVDLALLESQITALTRSWEDELQQCILSDTGNDQATRLATEFKHLFTAKYKADFSVQVAYDDIRYIDNLTEENPLGLKAYQLAGETGAVVHFRIFHLGEALPLSEVVPIIENLGAKCIEEHPYELVNELVNNGSSVWVRDFVLVLETPRVCSMAELKQIFEHAFYSIWVRGMENDGFNRLVPAAAMNVRQIAIIRTYARYFGQLQSANSQQFIAECVTRYASITLKLLQLFELRFDPEAAQNTRKTNKLVEVITALIGRDVANLSDDRVLHGYVEMILATQRTNYFQKAVSGRAKDYIVLKLKPADISEMPEPKPHYEIFVYSPRVEGVHLRGGKVARGGLRWSDRAEDYRTEVLGLVKAQQVKNSVIVPVGAKGGFLPKQLPKGDDRQAFMAEGIACYRIFIQGLLDVSDNLKASKVVKPKDVVCYDDDDYYLVVAADKGTATFSDIANEIAAENDFWLGDAFASGGSVGYDHKAMGITAKGAWKSVQQHFRDQGKDIQKTDFTVVGIGDMSGDVFGNGMLLSKHIRLTAAFNHLHIFIDPVPNAAKSFKERSRLFNLERSSWSDYKENLISKGGGIFSRTAKSIKISPEMKQCFAIKESQLTPNQLITAILLADTDLLWNGGIGTYVKSRAETHLDVADKANDAIRINGHQLGAKVVGEGGNLGMTQLARVEYCLSGGTCFTDFIDNAGGVNCSDAEVNIKILLNQLMTSNQLASGGRNGLLTRMTDEVADIVLDNNYRQAQVINLMAYQSKRRGHEYASLMRHLEDSGQLNRELEFLPSEDELSERRLRGESFTAPEISVLTSYVKSGLKAELATASFVDEPYVRAEMMVAFPKALTKKYSQTIETHQLQRELVATQIANNMVNYMGMNFVTRLQASTGESIPRIAKSYLVARDLLDLPARWQEICDLDYKVNHEVQKRMMMELIRLCRRVTRWLLRNRRRTAALEVEIDDFVNARAGVVAQLDGLLCGDAKVDWLARRDEYQAVGVPEELAGFVAAAHHLHAIMGISEAAKRSGQGVQRIAEVYFQLGEVLQLNWFSRQIHEYQADSRWQALAREALQDDLHWQQVALTQGIVSGANKTRTSAKLIADWVGQYKVQVGRWVDLQTEMRTSGVQDPAIFTVGIRELLDLAQSGRFAEKKF